MSKRIFIRVDGDETIGFGHVYRGLSLAHLLKPHVSIIFLSTSLSSELEKIIESYQYKVLRIKKSDNEITSLLQEKIIERGDVIVLDGYQFNINYQESLIQIGAKIIAISDFTTEKQVADIVINHAPGIKKSDYSASKRTRFYLGPEYALLRPEFLNRERNKKSPNNAKKVFICFGGTDQDYLIKQALASLNSFFKGMVTVVSQKLNISETYENLSLTVYQSRDATQMAFEIESSDFAIIPASGISLEALFLGTPMMVGFTADNQINIYHGLLKYPQVLGIGDYSVATEKKMTHLLTNAFKEDRFNSNICQILPKYKTLINDILTL